MKGTFNKQYILDIKYKILCLKKEVIELKEKYDQLKLVILRKKAELKRNNTLLVNPKSMESLKQIHKNKLTTKKEVKKS